MRLIDVILSVFNIIRVDNCVHSQGSSIFSETAASNYEGLSSNIFTAQIPNIPAKRLGTTEEVFVNQYLEFIFSFSI